MTLHSMPLHAKTIIELESIKISDTELLISKKKHDGKYSDRAILASILEKKIWNHLFLKFAIDSSTEAKISYFNKYHPNLLSKESYDLNNNLYRDSADAIEKVLENKLNKTQAFKQYLSKYDLGKQQWEGMLNAKYVKEAPQMFRDMAKQTYKDYSSERLALLSSNYLKGTVRKKICDLQDVKVKLKAYVELRKKLSFKKGKYTTEEANKIKKNRCHIEEQNWLKLYFKKNHKLYNNKYLGLEKYLSFYTKYF